MLSQLHIKNYALIDEIDISFSDGFNVITGETGSGKSIIIGALGLVLGERADSSIAKDKGEKCVVEATFLLEKQEVSTFFDENDLDYDQLTVIRREINKQGKSRAFINDTPVTLNVLKAFSSQIIDIHSQHNTIQLQKQSFQLNLVDALAKARPLLKEYQAKFEVFKGTKKTLETLEASAHKAKADEDYLKFVLSEFDALPLENLSQDELEQEQNVLENAEDIKSSLNQALQRIDHPESGILLQLRDVLQDLSGISNLSSKYEDLHERVNSVLIELRDIQSELEQEEEHVEYNPQRLEELNELLNKCYYLQKKHALSSLQELIIFKAETEEKLQQVANIDAAILAHKNKVKASENEALDLAKKLSKQRQDAFNDIETYVNQLLEDVAMPSAKLNISAKVKTLSSDGIDDVQFLIKTNKGSSFKPIQDIASGGELSRIMLALKTILSKYNALPTIIFDEIDTGVSGEVADKVGQVMKQLSENLQVFSITHLPQVASKGKQHYFVYKTESEEQTFTHIKLLSQDERVVEVAKMMSGEKPSEASLNSAKELLN